MGLSSCAPIFLAFSTFSLALSLPPLSLPPQLSLANSTSSSSSSNVSSVIASLSSNVSATEPTFGWEFSPAVSNISSGQNVINDPVCNTMFGTNLRLGSCLDVIRSWNMPVNSNIRTFGDRGRHVDIQLPRRTSSRESQSRLNLLQSSREHGFWN